MAWRMSIGKFTTLAWSKVRGCESKATMPSTSSESASRSTSFAPIEPAAPVIATRRPLAIANGVGEVEPEDAQALHLEGHADCVCARL